MSDEQSADLVRVYSAALASGAPPRVSVARYFRISVAAAASRIYRARKRGLIKPWRDTYRPVDIDEITGLILPATPTTPTAPEQPSRSERVSQMEPADRIALRKAFDDGKACPQCGGLHTRACPRVRRLVYNTNGTVAEVEFFPPGVWPDEAIIWPEDIESADDELSDE